MHTQHIDHYYQGEVGGGESVRAGMEEDIRTPPDANDPELQFDVTTPQSPALPAQAAGHREAAAPQKPRQQPGKKQAKRKKSARRAASDLGASYPANNNNSNSNSNNSTSTSSNNVNGSVSNNNAGSSSSNLNSNNREYVKTGSSTAVSPCTPPGPATAGFTASSDDERACTIRRIDPHPTGADAGEAPAKVAGPVLDSSPAGGERSVGAPPAPVGAPPAGNETSATGNAGDPKREAPDRGDASHKAGRGAREAAKTAPRDNEEQPRKSPDRAAKKKPRKPAAEVGEPADAGKEPPPVVKPRAARKELGGKKGSQQLPLVALAASMTPHEGRLPAPSAQRSRSSERVCKAKAAGIPSLTLDGGCPRTGGRHERGGARLRSGQRPGEGLAEKGRDPEDFVDVVVAETEVWSSSSEDSEGETQSHPNKSARSPQLMLSSGRSGNISQTNSNTVSSAGHSHSGSLRECRQSSSYNNSAHSSVSSPPGHSAGELRCLSTNPSPQMHQQTNRPPLVNPQGLLQPVPYSPEASDLKSSFFNRTLETCVTVHFCDSQAEVADALHARPNASFSQIDLVESYKNTTVHSTTINSTMLNATPPTDDIDKALNWYSNTPQNVSLCGKPPNMFPERRRRRSEVSASPPAEKQTDADAPEGEASSAAETSMATVPAATPTTAAPAPRRLAGDRSGKAALSCVVFPAAAASSEGAYTESQSPRHSPSPKNARRGSKFLAPLCTAAGGASDAAPPSANSSFDLDVPQPGLPLPATPRLLSNPLFPADADVEDRTFYHPREAPAPVEITIAQSPECAGLDLPPANPAVNADEPRPATRTFVDALEWSQKSIDNEGQVRGLVKAGAGGFEAALDELVASVQAALQGGLEKQNLSTVVAGLTRLETAVARHAAGLRPLLADVLAKQQSEFRLHAALTRLEAKMLFTSILDESSSLLLPLASRWIATLPLLFHTDTPAFEQIPGPLGLPRPIADLLASQLVPVDLVDQSSTLFKCVQQAVYRTLAARWKDCEEDLVVMWTDFCAAEDGSLSFDAIENAFFGALFSFLLFCTSMNNSTSQLRKSQRRECAAAHIQHR
ncbi:hypothetical protein DIPPA_31073 [Diplonema papillatum]|nr:hypothetical protein DIPPA_31073 [Diplonema papillatum]